MHLVPKRACLRLAWKAMLRLLTASAVEGAGTKDGFADVVEVADPRDCVFDAQAETRVGAAPWQPVVEGADSRQLPGLKSTACSEAGTQSAHKWSGERGQLENRGGYGLEVSVVRPCSRRSPESITFSPFPSTVRLVVVRSV